MSAPDFADVYNAVAETYSGDLFRDLAERNLPAESVVEVSKTAGTWAASTSAPTVVHAAALAFDLGVMVGVEWARAARQREEQR